mgnify:CR=1 FL=1
MLLPRTIKWTPGQISGLQGYGVDRCVVYTDNWAEAWNGVTSVKKKFNRKERRPLYIDGRKIGLFPNQTDPTWEVTSYSYPSLFDGNFGTENFEDVLVYDQDESKKLMHMTYRTWVSPKEYYVHCVLNIHPYISETASQTFNPNPTPNELSFVIETEPYKILEGRYKTNHVAISSRFIEGNEILKQLFEDKLYGSVRNGTPYVPNGDLVEDLLETVLKSHKEYVLVKSEDYATSGEWVLLGPDDLLKESKNGEFTANRINAQFHKEGDVTIIDGKLV